MLTTALFNLNNTTNVTKIFYKSLSTFVNKSSMTEGVTGFKGNTLAEPAYRLTRRRPFVKKGYQPRMAKFKNFCFWWLKAQRKRRKFYKFWMRLTGKRYIALKPYSAQYRRFSLYRTWAQKALYFPYRNRFVNLASMPRYVNYRQLFHNQIYEKQTFRKLWRFTHRDLVRHFRKAVKHRKRLFDMNFIKYFEFRLDTVAYRANLAFSYLEARQKAKRGHFLVNGLVMNRPNYNLNIGDCITPSYDQIQSSDYQFVRLISRPLQIDQYPSYLLINERVPVAMIFRNPRPTEIKHTLPISWNFITFAMLRYK